MNQERAPALRGFDSYELRLGDELRGQRATLGKSLLDVQRELRIKASYIDAIENCDASVIPNRGFVPGYVRAYARYLGLGAETVYARFCAESGFVGQTSRAAQPGAAPRGGFRLGGGAGLGGAAGGAGRDPALSRSHFAAPIGRARRVGLGVSLSDLASVAVLAALIGGLGWGAWLVVEEVQRVEFAPGNEAPETVAGGPGALPGLALQAAPAPWLSSGPEREAALAELYAPREAAEPPVVQLRDGPIAAIDPARSGFYAERATPATAVAAAPPAPEGPRPVTEAPLIPAAVAGPPEPALDPAVRGLWLEATAPCWVQVKDASGAVIFERIMDAGDRWSAPDRGAGLVLRAGNAGGLLVEIDGRDHGPLGRSGEVVKNVPLAAERVAADWPEAPRPASGPQPARAEAKLELE